jgi:hypothetical protein
MHCLCVERNKGIGHKKIFLKNLNIFFYFEKRSSPPTMYITGVAVINSEVVGLALASAFYGAPNQCICLCYGNYIFCTIFGPLYAKKITSFSKTNVTIAFCGRIAAF